MGGVPHPWVGLGGGPGPIEGGPGVPPHPPQMDPARLRVEVLEGELQRAGAVLGGSLRVLPRLRRELEGLRGERRRLRRLLRRRLQELEQTQREIEAELERAAPAQSDGVPRGSRGSRGAPAEPERGRGRHREQQRRLRRFLEIKGRARPRPKPRDPPEILGDPPEGMGEGLEPPKNEEEEEEEEPWMDGDSRAFSQFLLLTEQHRELQELQQHLEQLRAAVAAAEEPPEEPGGPPGDPELEIRELREQERRGREELEELRAGLGALLAQLEEGQGDPDPPLEPPWDPPQFGDPPQDPPQDPSQDPLWEQLRLLERAVGRLLLGGGHPHTEVLAGNDPSRSRPPPPRPPSPREGEQEEEEEEEEEERPLSPGELRERVLREVLSREGPLPTPRLDLGGVPRPP